MRARHRHFNPRDAGATASFDSRYGFNLSSGDAVDTWKNRTGSNNATQSTSSLKPSYETSGGSGGNPRILFASDSLRHSISLTVAPNLIMAVAIRTGGGDFSVIAAFMPPSTANYNIMYATQTGGNFANWSVSPANSGQSLLNTWRICTAKPADTLTSSGSTTVWTNGANETTGTGNRYGGDGFDRRGIGESWRGAEDYFGGSLSLVTAIPADVGNPLRKRLEHAAAYSFKISCN